MSGCKFTDFVSVHWKDGNPEWAETGRFISIHEDVLKDPVMVEFIGTAYDIGEPCPDHPTETHATLRDELEWGDEL